MTRVTTSLAALAIAGLGLAGALSPTSAGDVSIGISIGSPPPPTPAIVVTAPPQIVVVPGTPIYYYGGRYFMYQDPSWFVAVNHDGPWTYMALGHVPQPVLAAPGTYYRHGGGPHGCPPGLAKQGRC